MLWWLKWRWYVALFVSIMYIGSSCRVLFQPPLLAVASHLNVFYFSHLDTQEDDQRGVKQKCERKACSKRLWMSETLKGYKKSILKFSKFDSFWHPSFARFCWFCCCFCSLLGIGLFSNRRAWALYRIIHNIFISRCEREWAMKINYKAFECAMRVLSAPKTERRKKETSKSKEEEK